jgi:hypothetical protein
MKNVTLGMLWPKLEEAVVKSFHITHCLHLNGHGAACDVTILIDFPPATWMRSWELQNRLKDWHSCNYTRQFDSNTYGLIDFLKKKSQTMILHIFWFSWIFFMFPFSWFMFLVLFVTEKKRRKLVHCSMQHWWGREMLRQKKFKVQTLRNWYQENRWAYKCMQPVDNWAKPLSFVFQAKLAHFHKIKGQTSFMIDKKITKTEEWRKKKFYKTRKMINFRIELINTWRHQVMCTSDLFSSASDGSACAVVDVWLQNILKNSSIHLHEENLAIHSSALNLIAVPINCIISDYGHFTKHGADGGNWNLLCNTKLCWIDIAPPLWLNGIARIALWWIRLSVGSSQ